MSSRERNVKNHRPISDSIKTRQIERPKKQQITALAATQMKSFFNLIQLSYAPLADKVYNAETIECCCEIIGLN